MADNLDWEDYIITIGAVVFTLIIVGGVFYSWFFAPTSQPGNDTQNNDNLVDHPAPINESYTWWNTADESEGMQTVQYRIEGTNDTVIHIYHDGEENLTFEDPSDNWHFSQNVETGTEITLAVVKGGVEYQVSEFTAQEQNPTPESVEPMQLSGNVEVGAAEKWRTVRVTCNSGHNYQQGSGIDSFRFVIIKEDGSEENGPMVPADVFCQQSIPLSGIDKNATVVLYGVDTTPNGVQRVQVGSWDLDETENGTE